MHCVSGIDYCLLHRFDAKRAYSISKSYHVFGVKKHFNVSWSAGTFRPITKTTLHSQHHKVFICKATTVTVKLAQNKLNKHKLTENCFKVVIHANEFGYRYEGGNLQKLRYSLTARQNTNFVHDIKSGWHNSVTKSILKKLMRCACR